MKKLIKNGQSITCRFQISLGAILLGAVANIIKNQNRNTVAGKMWDPPRGGGWVGTPRKIGLGVWNDQNLQFSLN